MTTWPGRGGAEDIRTLEKVPTELNYGSGGGLNMWGYQLPAGDQRYGCFKLLLDHETGGTKWDDPNLGSSVDEGNPNALLQLPPGKDVLQVTTDYMKPLYAHLMDHLRKRVARTIDATPIQFVLTTPAIWSHAAQHSTCEAAKKAGFGTRPGDTITMISEPEAAALYTIKELNSGQNGHFKESKLYIPPNCYLSIHKPLVIRLLANCNGNIVGRTYCSLRRWWRYCGAYPNPKHNLENQRANI